MVDLLIVSKECGVFQALDDSWLFYLPTEIHPEAKVSLCRLFLLSGLYNEVLLNNKLNLNIDQVTIGKR